MSAHHRSADRVPVLRAVYLLRVSSARQMHTASDIDPEGNSIPTQRSCCDVKCKELRAIKVGEYIEPGYSGQSIEKRPVFKELLKRIKEQRDVDYVIIYMRSRIFRNYKEAVAVKTALEKLGVRIISAKENFGDGDMGEAMEAITDIFNWLEVRRNGADIATKMLNKVKNGGSVGRAKVGYLNVTVNIDGHKVNTVTKDDERAPLVAMAFELAATGKFSNVEQIHAKATAAGLTMPGTGKPVSMQTMWRMLRDRYYCGYVTYKGVEYKGRHEPLITEELFDRVQQVLDTHSGIGVRQRSHPHYLKGSIWCNRCKKRFLVQRTKGKSGGIYFYFFCVGRQERICDHPYIPVEVMEHAVINHYTRIGLPEKFRALVRSVIDQAATDNHKLSDDMREGFTKQLAKLDSKENYFLDLAAEEGWPKDKLREKISAIRTDRHTITRSLEQAENQLDDGIQFLTLALELMTDPHAMYRTGNEAVRTIMNKTIFAKLYVDGDTITGHELREPFNVLAEAYSMWQGYPQETNTASGKRPSRATGPRSALHTALPAQRGSAAPETGYGTTERTTVSPALALLARGSSKTHMVDLVSAYSKRADLLVDLDHAGQQLRQADEDTTLRSVRSIGRVGRAHSLQDRLSNSDVRRIILSFQGGTPRYKIAAQFSISVSSVGRLLRMRRKHY